jgi:membrane protein DedA with SNARE-associated domain
VQQWITVWFQWVHDWGYPGIVLLMAMESSIIPIPSEIVIPPAAYWASQGRYSMAGVVLAGTFGSYIGATAMYWVARWLGRPLLLRYGRYVFCPPKKLIRAERWLARYEVGGVFFARLIPVVRHLIGIPAGIVRMPFGVYSAVTIIGSALWCAVLAWFGSEVLGDHPDLMQDPARLAQVLGERSILIGSFAVALCVLYVVVMLLTAPSKKR